MKYENFKTELPGRNKPKPRVLKPGEVEVVLGFKFRTEDRKAWIEVAVHSQVRPEVSARKNVDADQPQLESHVQHAAETLAQYLCENLGDKIDPVAVGKAAIEALKEIQRKADLARQGKLKIVPVRSEKSHF
jgi:hypothetical protein